ncbi:MAG: hypothetical protein RL326_576, partial [Pseudomonadota bacterium]
MSVPRHLASNVPHVAVVIPCYRASSHILSVLSKLGPEVASIIVVDDACPERTADVVERGCQDPRVTIVRLPRNLGVGG